MATNSGLQAMAEQKLREMARERGISFEELVSEILKEMIGEDSAQLDRQHRN